MLGFVNCVQELCNYVQKKEKDQPSKLCTQFYSIEDHKVDGYSIFYQNDERKWTKACKRLLINLKLLQVSRD